MWPNITSTTRMKMWRIWRTLRARYILIWAMLMVSTKYGHYPQNVDNIHRVQIYPQNTDDIHGTLIFLWNVNNIHITWIFPCYVDISTIISKTRMKYHNITHNFITHLYSFQNWRYVYVRHTCPWDYGRVRINNEGVKLSLQ